MTDFIKDPEPPEGAENGLDEQDRLAGAWDRPASEDALEYAKGDPTEDAEPHEDDPEEGTPG